ncbi:50S ribosomal protein L22 [Candidatus Woesearchaeota archaeon CG10_big_fil_rev_8_21_14_0_10_30_7]|nr:MAG: 50S ribosomal protein L22 [Candidatus Woesearchaeota archaeon CG10_big_fil_rev_8_21_14_0_10_30_7]
MSKKNYSTKPGENSAKALGTNLTISPKQSIEVCSFIRNRKLQVAKKMLEEVLTKTIAVPFTRYNKGLGHRKGNMASGKYPLKTCSQILKLLNSAESNAQNKGLNSNNLVITHINAHRGTRIQRHKRVGSTTAKLTHVEIVLEEQK